MMRYLFFILLASFAGLSSSAWHSFAAEPFPDFTFKRVKPPAPGVAKRITIQVENPVDQKATPKDQAPVEAGDLQAWFWNEISPALDSAGPGRFTAALQQLQAAPPESQLSVPSLQFMRQVALDHGTDILLATIGKKISPAFVLAVIGVESSGNPDAHSVAGALGLMQLIPATAQRFDVADPLNPSQNIKGGVAYLDYLLQKFGGDPILALAGYNAGENAVLDNGGVPPFAETRAYVPKVLAAWQVARALCLTPPELYSDGCVFAVKDSN